MSGLDDSFNALLAAAGDLEALIDRAASTSPERRQRDLLIALNRIELCILSLPDADKPSSFDKPPDQKEPNTHGKRRGEVLAAFPEFSLYYVMGMHRKMHSGLELEKPPFGDATCDLSDILSDLDYVRWIASKEGRSSATWWAKWHHDHHLGVTFADLRSYLSRLRYFVP